MSYKKCIIQLNTKLSTNYRNKGLKKYLQNNPTCEICGRKAENVHHEIPIAIGGSNEEYNLISLCECCHEKAHKYGIRKKKLQKFGIDLLKNSNYALVSYSEVLQIIEEKGYDVDVVDMLDIMEKCIIGYISGDHISIDTKQYITEKEMELENYKNKISDVNIVKYKNNEQLKFDFDEVKK